MGNLKIVRKTVYRCTVCGTEHESRARFDSTCGAYELEAPAFRIGDEVLVWYANKERRCTVTRRIGPVIGNRCKEGKRPRLVYAHVYRYRVKPVKQQIDGVRVECEFWTCELKRG